ncbi:BrnA antitoxin family protein [Castellaniella caeni]|uniref:BrnA antitoxin family protein n=1 Tax=Castellaniella caeni TaxID=266123 RepID=UPI000836E4D0|nr:BrnA antitoxin family protein [Castellaniella caeni]
MKKPDPELSDADNPEWSDADFARARPAAEVLPVALHEKLGIRRRGPQKAPVKKLITIRLSPEVVDGFRASGPGWQARVDAVLKTWLKTHRA